VAEATHDLLDDLGGGVQVDETLVDPHLESVPSLGTLTTGTSASEKGRRNSLGQLVVFCADARLVKRGEILTTSWW
jgi:hypothetical protein